VNVQLQVQRVNIQLKYMPTAMWPISFRFLHQNRVCTSSVRATCVSPLTVLDLTVRIYSGSLPMTVVLSRAPSRCAACIVHSISHVSSEESHPGVDCAGLMPLRSPLLVSGRFLFRFTSGTITKFCAAAQVTGHCNRVDFECADVLVSGPSALDAGQYDGVSL